jgi:hypothetical protein
MTIPDRGRTFLFALLLHGLLLAGCTPRSEESGHTAPQAEASARRQFKSQLISQTIERPLKSIPDREHEEAWKGAFWGMGLARYRSPITDEAVLKSYASVESLSVSFHRALLEVTYTLYRGELQEQVSRFLMNTGEEKLFAMAALHLLRDKPDGDVRPLRTLMQKRFPGWREHPILVSLSFDLDSFAHRVPYVHPPLVDILKHRLSPAAPAVFSFQRTDRRWPGLVVVRDASGRFFRNNDGSLFCVPQLALAASNLPGYLTNGNTPQGVLSMQGFLPVTNTFIGPTETIQLVLPFEAPVQAYFHRPDTRDTVWTESLYARLLPESWREFTPAFEAFRAGRAGRTEIIAHGTTIDPEFYRGEPCYPNTPSQGCLTALEVWSSTTGKNCSSDQQALVDMLKKHQAGGGFFYVINLDDRGGPVALEEVQAEILWAEGMPGGAGEK